MKKLNYLDILTETFNVYKKDFIAFVKISGLLGIINFAISVISNLLFEFTSSILTIAIGSINLIIMIFLFYNYIKVYCTNINYVYNKVTLNDISFKESFWYSKRLAPKFIYASILLIVLEIIPIFLLIVSYSTLTNQILKWSLTILFLLITLFIFVRYYFIIYIRVIEPDNKNYITKCVTYLKGNYITYFFILTTIHIYTIGYIALNNFVLLNIKLNILQQIIVSGIYNLINIFIMPIIIIANVLIYHKLVAK